MTGTEPPPRDEARTVRCPECEARVDAELAACPACGTELADDAAARAAAPG